MSESDAFMFQGDENGSIDLESAVFQALGAASVCWSQTPRGIFESDRAKEIGETLLKFILDRDAPNLGLARTGDLLRELTIRMTVTQNSAAGRELGRLCEQALLNLDKRVLDYRTAD